MELCDNQIELIMFLREKPCKLVQFAHNRRINPCVLIAALKMSLEKSGCVYMFVAISKNVLRWMKIMGQETQVDNWKTAPNPQTHLTDKQLQSRNKPANLTKRENVLLSGRLGVCWGGCDSNWQIVQQKKKEKKKKQKSDSLGKTKASISWAACWRRGWRRTGLKRTQKLWTLQTSCESSAEEWATANQSSCTEPTRSELFGSRAEAIMSAAHTYKDAWYERWEKAMSKGLVVVFFFII